MKAVRAAWDQRELAVFKDRFSAERAVEALRESGIHPKEVSAFDEDTRRELASPPIPEAIGGAIVFAYAGSFLGALVASTSPPTIWAAVVVGAIVGAFVGMRLGSRDPWYRRVLRRHQLPAGAILLHVRCAPTEREGVRRVLRSEGGTSAEGATT